MQVTIVTPASDLPCSVDFMLRHMRVLPEDVDLALFAMRASVAACEEYTGRLFIQQILKLTMAGWPVVSESWGINRPAPKYRQLPGIKLPGSPLVAINSVNYWPAGGGAQIEWDPANYAMDLTTLPGRLVPNEGAELPDVAERHDAIEIEFEAGHGTAQHEMPYNYLAAALLFARHLFDNPGVVDMDGKVRQMPMSFKFLLQSQKVH